MRGKRLVVLIEIIIYVVVVVWGVVWVQHYAGH
jgi:hypothetical protein